ncbi:hypothetical protein [Streptomyces sp. enrichment culture]|uniref:hypothetical protein n=1 Tax=Streptomyces sp. enrichment culture TaxID=1795815 RepID=UPI003F559EE0
MKPQRIGCGASAIAALFGLIGGFACWALLDSAQQKASSVSVEGQRENHVKPVLIAARTATVTSTLTMDGRVVKNSGRYLVRATVAPAHLYRFIDSPRTAQVKIVDGPEPFTCADVTIGTDPADPSGDVYVSCTVPASVKVFAGLPVKVAVRTGHAENAVVVPISALSGTAGSAHVTVVDGDGRRTQREVVVGVVNGVLAQVTHGLKAGEKVQDPVADAFRGGDLKEIG